MLVKQVCVIYIKIQFFLLHFYVLLTVQLSIILGSDQLDTQLLKFTKRL